jgi:hypothetical protein
MSAKMAPQHHRMPAASDQRAACTAVPGRCTESAASLHCRGAAALRQQDTTGPWGGASSACSFLAAYTPACLGTELHLLTAQIEALLGPNLGADLPNGFNPPMEQKHEDAFLRRFRMVMHRMGLPTDHMQSVRAPVSIGVLIETCGVEVRRPEDNCKLRRVWSPGSGGVLQVPADENTNPNRL